MIALLSSRVIFLIMAAYTFKFTTPGSIVINKNFSLEPLWKLVRDFIENCQYFLPCASHFCEKAHQMSGCPCLQRILKDSQKQVYQIPCQFTILSVYLPCSTFTTDDDRLVSSVQISFEVTKSSPTNSKYVGRIFLKEDKNASFTGKIKKKILYCAKYM